MAPALTTAFLPKERTADLLRAITQLFRCGKAPVPWGGGGQRKGWVTPGLLAIPEALKGLTHLK